MRKWTLWSEEKLKCRGVRRSAGGKDETSGPVMLVRGESWGSWPSCSPASSPFFSWGCMVQLCSYGNILWEHPHTNLLLLEMLSESLFFATQRTELKCFKKKKKKALFLRAVLGSQHRAPMYPFTPPPLLYYSHLALMLHLLQWWPTCYNDEPIRIHYC